MMKNGFCLWALGSGILAGAMTVSACAKAQAKAIPEGPPLQVPEAPPRVIVALEEPLPAAPPVDETAVAAPAAPKPSPPPRIPARTEPKPEPPVITAAPDPKPAPEPRTLRTPGDSASERAIRDRLLIASRDLGRVDYAKLSVSGRAQYEQSKRFVQQAEQALKEQNLVYAATLADKAATLAAELVAR